MSSKLPINLENLLRQRKVEGNGSYFLIRLPVRPKIESEESCLEGKKEKVSEKVSEKASEKMSEKVLSLMRENLHMATPEIAEAVGRSARAIEMQVAELKIEGLIERIGPAKGGYWIVKEES